MDNKDFILQIYHKQNGIGPLDKQKFFELIDEDPRILAYILLYHFKKDRLIITYRPNTPVKPTDVMVDRQDGFFTLYPTKDNEKMLMVSRYSDFPKRFSNHIDSEIGVNSFSMISFPTVDSRYKIYTIQPHFDIENAARLNSEYTSAQQKAQDIAKELTQGLQLPETIRLFLAMNFMIQNYSYDYSSLSYINHLIETKETMEIGKHHSSNSYGVFFENKAVCAGLTHAFNRILKAMDIPAKQVTGEIKPTLFNNGGPHSWSAVYISGQWYHCDVTAAIGTRRIFDCMLNTNNQIARRYQWNRSLPDCETQYDKLKIKEWLNEHRKDLQKKGINQKYLFW